MHRETRPLPEALLRQFRKDPYARRMGFDLQHAAPGYACVTVNLTQHFFNFAGTPHGGLIFSLADYAFAVASNSHGQVALVTHVSVQFMAAPQNGQRLTAEAQVTHHTRRTAYYTMRVHHPRWPTDRPTPRNRTAVESTGGRGLRLLTNQ